MMRLLVFLALLSCTACRTAGAVPPAQPEPQPAAVEAHAPGSPVTLQKAYDGGRTIDGAAGPVEVSGAGIVASQVALTGDPAAAQLTWLTIGADKVVQLFNSAGKLFLTASGSVLVSGDEKARLNSKNGAAEVVGKSVSILAQNGEVSIDATTVVTLTTVLLRGVSSDPPLEDAGQIWYRSDLKKIRFYDGTSIKNLAVAP